MKLAELQRAFFARIAQVGEVDERLEAEVRSFGALTGAERLDLYANMYFLRLVGVLREDFSAVAKLLGDEQFEATVAEYVRVQPSRHPSLAELGRGFPGFLALRSSRAQSREEQREPVHPSTALGMNGGLEMIGGAAELAALEWARAEVRIAADAVPATREALAALGPEHFGDARLTLIPALRVLSFSHDVPALWQALEQGAEAPTAAETPTSVVVWRKGFEVFHAAVSAEEANALRLAGEGNTIEALCAAFESAEEPVLAAFTALGSWLAEEMVARVDA